VGFESFPRAVGVGAGGPLTLNALFNGQIDVGNVFSTDSAITTNKLVVLEDPKNLYLILAATGPSPA